MREFVFVFVAVHATTELSLLALKSPQACLAGYYCAGRAGSSYGSGACPEGTFCGPGSTEPEGAPQGSFVGSSGSVKPYSCPSGYFSPYGGLAVCLPCPPGYSCANPATIVPFICQPGTYRSFSSSSSIACSSCSEGTFSPWRGVPDETSCEPCPAGRLCLTKTSNITGSNPCPEGYMCGEGTTLSTSSNHACLNGFFCPSQTTPLTVYSYLCPEGYMCGSGTTFAGRFRTRCPRGFYCPEGSPWRAAMDNPPVSPGTMLSPGQFYILQVAGQYCLRQVQAQEYAKIKSENAQLEAAGLPPISPNQFAVRMALWTKNITACVELQMPHVSLLSRSTSPLSSLVLMHARWHAVLLLELESEQRPDLYKNKCITEQFSRLDGDTTWECLCTANVSDGSLIGCLTNKEGGNIGAPFEYDSSYSIDNPKWNCDVDWPNCFDWSRIGNYESGMEVSKESGPSTGPAYDEFDVMAVPYVEYIAETLEFTFLLFANVSSSSLTTCPYGTLTAMEGASSLNACEKRILIPTLNEPEKEIIVSRVNPVNTELVDQTPRQGYPFNSEEDLRLVFRLKAREFGTITIDVRDLPDHIEYGRDWVVSVFSGNELEPDGNDGQECADTWQTFLQDHSSGSGGTITPTQRDQTLLEHNCAWTHNPLGFEAFQLATGSVCPSSSGPYSSVCLVAKLTTSSLMESCNPLKRPVKIHELYLHALVDVDFRIEVQILNGMYASDRFKFIQSVAIKTESPRRAELNTNKAFVVQTSETEAKTVNIAYNSPIQTSNSETINGNISGIPASSQSGILTRNFLSWLPRTKSIPLTNCMRHTDRWEGEFLQPPNIAYLGRSNVIQTHLPFFSNCRGYGTAIPLWHITESEACRLVPENETVAIAFTSFRGSSVGDSCQISLECMVDEVPNNKLPLNRWFEAPTGTELFRLSYEAQSAETYAGISSSFDESNIPSIPVILRQGARSDGSSFTKVELRLRYWQRSTTVKVITTGDVYFKDFAYLTDDQNKGRSVWNYTLQVVWQPMTHIEVLNSFGFPGGLYIIYSVIVGAICFGIVVAHWAYHWLLTPGQVLYSRLRDRRYLTLIFPQMLEGISFSLIPIATGLILFVCIFFAETSLFTLTPFQCDTSNPLGCRATFLDVLPSSWSGESSRNPNSYSTRRKGRTGTALLVLGSYLVLVTMRAFIPGLVSRYYTEDTQEDKEEDRSWPPDQKIFAPLVYKRSAWFLLISGSCVVCTLLLEFSYSLIFMDAWWLCTIGVLAVSKLVGFLVVQVMQEETLKIPVAVLFEVVAYIVTLGSPDFYSSTITVFIIQAALLVDRTYLTPLEQATFREIKRIVNRFLAYVKKVVKGGTLSRAVDAANQVNDPGNEGNASSFQRQMTIADRERGDGMMVYLSAFVTNVLASVLTPIALLLMSLFYESTQSFNVYNISSSEAKYYWGFQLCMLVFRSLVAVIALNTAESFHEWKILDYLEYCRYKFVNRPHRWKGINETYDESVTPYLRSLDLLSFSPQFYFSLFLVSFGSLLFLLGTQVLINNSWNVFDDQATPFIIIIGVVSLGILRSFISVIADYLKVWFVKRSDETLGVTEEENELVARILRGFDYDEVVVKAPATSALHNWPEPRVGDRVGWERYRMAYLKENQLWLQAHMDSLIDGPTTVEFRKVLMDSLAKVLNESNILKLSAKTSTADGVDSLEVNGLPPHEAVVRNLQDEKEMIKGSRLELAARTWLVRARFMRFLRYSVAELRLNQAVMKSYCESCRARSSRLYICPQYPVPYVAEQLRIQRDMHPVWNVPVWQRFFAHFTPACTLCEKCAIFFAKRDLPIPLGVNMPDDGKPKSCDEVIEQSPYPLHALSDQSMLQLHSLLNWAEYTHHPRVTVDAFLNSPITENDISESTKAILAHWLARVR